MPPTTTEQDALAFLRYRGLFGNLIDSPEFTTAYADTLISLHEHGAEATLEALLAKTTA